MAAAPKTVMDASRSSSNENQASLCTLSVPGDMVQVPRMVMLWWLTVDVDKILRGQTLLTSIYESCFCLLGVQARAADSSSQLDDCFGFVSGQVLSDGVFKRDWIPAEPG